MFFILGRMKQNLQCLAADRARWEKGLARHAVAADWRLKATSYQTGRAKTVHTQPGAFPLSEHAVLYVTSTRAARRGFTTHGTSAISRVGRSRSGGGTPIGGAGRGAHAVNPTQNFPTHLQVHTARKRNTVT